MSATVTLLITKLGIPVAKALAGLWIENKVGLAVAGSVVDILGGKISDEVARKRVATQLEKLGKSISTKLEPAFAPIVGTGEADALADHLALLVLRVAEIPRDLLKISIDPRQVADRLAAADCQWVTVRRQFGAHGYKAYSDALTIIAGELLTNLHMLPNWETAAMLEALQRMDQIASLLERIELPDRLFEERYRHALGQKCNVMELFGLPQTVSRNTALKAHTTLKLDQSYVTLSLSSSAGGDSAASILDRADHNGRLRLLVTGEAGCGKTTLMRWIGVQCALRALEKIDLPAERIGTDLVRQTRTLMDWRLRVPFLIRLRHIESIGLPDFTKWTEVEGQPLSPAPYAWVDRVLRDGRALILIDGLDEYPEDLRPSLLKSLHAHLDLHPDNACIVTSRRAAVPAGLDQYCRLDQAHVMELTEANRQNLIYSWFRALPAALKDDAGDRIDTYPTELIRQIERRPALMQMAGNPLLCSMFCALKFGTEGELPSDVVKVCAEFVDMLLYRRDKDGDLRKAATPDYALLSADDRASIARQLAHSMVDAGLSEVTLQRAQQFIHHTVECLPPERVGNLFNEPERVLTAMLERSGLLQLAERGKVQFVHNSLKEYLAASHYAVNSQVERVVAQLPNSPWDRVAQFMMGLNLSNEVTATLLEQMLNLVEDHTLSEQRRRSVALLAMMSASSKGGINGKLRSRLAALCHPFLPPQTADEAALLAHMGDTVLSLMRKEAITTVKEAAAVARCLRMIGTEAAKRQLMDQYANVSNQEVAFEVVQILNPMECYGFWQWLASRAFIEHRYNEISYITRNIISIPPLDIFKSISKLNLDSFTNFSDTSSFKEYPNINWINLSNTAVVNLSGFKDQQYLQGLDLCNTAVSDVFYLSNINSLQSLDLHNTAVSDVRALSSLNNLQYLDLSYTAVCDVSTLASLKNLRSLNLSCTAVRDVSALASLTNLQNLDLSNTAVSDVHELAGLDNLQCLYLSNTAISDVNILTSLNNLRNLDVTNTAVSDVNALKKNKKLQIIGK